MSTNTSEATGQRRRSIAIALALGGLVLVFYAATIVHLGPNAMKKAGIGRAEAAKNKAVPTEGKAGSSQSAPAPGVVQDGEPACKKANTC